jgi:RNA polymerase sigma-70 factor (ECF subfamily)
MDKRRIKLFENICNRYSKELQRFIYTLARKNQFEMEEIFQNTMEMAYKNLEYLRDENKIKTWIFSIAKTEARRYYSINKKYFDHEINELNEDLFSVEDNVDFTENIIDSNLAMQILNELSDESQQVFILYYYYDIPFNEISEILHINYNTIRSIHSRGISRMKKLYNEKGNKNEG